jgi:hypothetical protein
VSVGVDDPMVQAAPKLRASFCAWVVMVAPPWQGVAGSMIPPSRHVGSAEALGAVGRSGHRRVVEASSRGRAGTASDSPTAASIAGTERRISETVLAELRTIAASRDDTAQRSAHLLGLVRSRRYPSRLRERLYNARAMKTSPR